MPILNDKEYQCDFCKGVFEFVRNEEWNMDKVEKEYEKEFPLQSKENREIVCDDCWKIVRPQ